MSEARVQSTPDMALAEILFRRLEQDSHDGVGITRDAYGAGEQRAHDLMTEVARDLGLEVKLDAAANLYLTLPGLDRQAPAVMTGSHLDSVPQGGNYDGAAGVIAGLAVLAGWRHAGYTPRCDVTVMGVRAEESTWFPYSYLGSKAAFGKVARDVLQLKRSDTGQVLAEHLARCGGDPEAFGTAQLAAPRIARFAELHIEQGPVLVDAGLPAGIVTGIRGSLRYRDARALGTYAHSGAAPRANRRDAVRAAALLVAAIDTDWEAMEESGADLVVTFGKFYTDAAQHAFSKVAGEVNFCIDARSLDTTVLDTFDALLATRVTRIAASSRVRFVLGARTGSDPAAMDPSIRAELRACARRQGIAAMEMASGAGHDAAVFAQMGVPTAMVFVRNDHGSHNPDEKMDLGDFEIATRLLEGILQPAAR